MEKTVSNALNNPVLMTWLSYLIQYGSAFLILPVILHIFSAEEVAVWLLFMTVYGVAMLADSGFSHAIIRASAYFFNGATALPHADSTPSDTESKQPNLSSLASLFITSRRFYLFVTLIAIALLSSIGVILVHNVIQLAGNSTKHWVAFILLITASVFRIFYVRYASFLQGINRVAYVRRLESLMGALRIMLYLGFILAGTNVIGLILVDCLYGFSLLLIARRSCYQFFSHNHYSNVQHHSFNKSLFLDMWPASWRFGLAAYGAYLITNGCTLLVSQLDDVKLISAYLLTVRIVAIIRQIVQAPLYAHLPKLIGLYAQREFEQLKMLAARGIIIILLLASIALVLLCLLGNTMLEFISANNTLLANKFIVLIGIALLLDLHHSAHVQIYLSSNHMPFLIPALVSGIAIICLGYITMQYWGLWGLLWTQFLVQLSFNNWYPVKLSLRLLNWPLTSYLAMLRNVFPIPRKLTSFYKMKL